MKKVNENEPKLHRTTSLSYRIEPYLYLIPALIFFGMFTFFPFLKTIFLSFSITSPQGAFVRLNGISNYKEIFTSKDFLNSMVVSFKYAFGVVAFSMLLGLILAIISNEEIPLGGFFHTIYALPMAISAAAAAAMFNFILHPTVGSLNYILHTEIGWLITPKWALVSVTMVTIWMQIGINFIFILAALQSVPIDLYESAELEGAGFLAKHWHITIPCISPTLFYLLITNVITALQQYAQVRMMTSGGPSGATNVIVYEIFTQAFTNGRFGLACAESVVLFIILMILTSILFKLEKKVTY